MPLINDLVTSRRSHLEAETRCPARQSLIQQTPFSSFEELAVSSPFRRGHSTHISEKPREQQET